MVKRRRKNRKLIFICIGLFILIGLCVLPFAALNDDLTATEYEVELEGLPSGLDGCRVLLIADLHCARFGPAQEELIAAVKSAEPDLTVLCGDILDSRINDTEPIEELLQGICPSPVFAIYGNHENGVSYFDRADLADLYESYGVVLLEDSSATFTLNGEDILVTGMADPAFWGKGDTEFVAQNPPDVSPAEDAFDLLLCHRANLYPAVSGMGFDLVLSGHLHGGQVRIPLLGGLISPAMELFPDYTCGVYRENGSVLVVSRGLGNSVDVPRVFNRPELVTVILRSPDNT